MAKATNTFALGATVLFLFALLFGSLIFIGGSDLLQPERHAYTVRFAASDPLPEKVERGAAVFCGLRDVGKVTSVEHNTVDVPAGERVYVHLGVRIDADLPLRSDCEIVVRGPLLGGGGRVVITDPGRTGAILKPGSEIEGNPSATFDAILEQLAREIDADNPQGLVGLIKAELDAGNAQSMLAKIHRSIEDVNAITREIRLQANPQERDALLAKLNRVLDHVNAATRSIRAQLSTGPDDTALAKIHVSLDALNANLAVALEMLESTRPDVEATIAGARRTIETLDARIATPIAEELDSDAEKSLLAKLHVSFDRLNRSLADITDVSGEARELVILNKGRIDQIFANVSETSEHLKAASKEIRRSPWRLLYRPSLEETRELNIYDASREFADAAARLDDASTQLRALLEAHEGRIPKDDPDLARIRARLEETFEKYKQAEEALWKALAGN